MTFQTGTALVVIAKNEQRCIARCLESAAQYVDRIVVLDTGSTDETVSIAKRCGAAVHHASWKNDFSYARNLALDIANSEFNLIIDADEWIISVEKTLNLRTLNPRELGLVSILSEGESGREKQIQNSWITRLLPHGVRYRGKVHEQAISNRLCCTNRVYSLLGSRFVSEQTSRCRSRQPSNTVRRTGKRTTRG